MSKQERMEKIERLSKFFNSQIKTLADLNCPKKAIDILREHEERVVVACLRIRIPPTRIPFVPVITPAYCELTELMAMVRLGQERGRVRDWLIKDRYPIVDAVGSQPFLRPYFYPYYAINIEDGTLTEGMDVRKSYGKILSVNRSPLTVAESISLCILTDVLSRHDLWIAGSRWETEEKIPKTSGDSPYLDYEHIDDCHEQGWGTPSCGARVG